jgi:HNH endonuclease
MTQRTNGPSANVRIRVMKRDRFRCTYCGVAGTDAELEVDHIIALANGGSHHMSNLTTACRACNQLKGSRKAPPKASAQQQQHSLIGLWFHVFKDGELQWQGQILSVDGSQVIAQLYEWFFGTPAEVQIIAKAVIYSERCALYPSREHLIEAAKAIYRQRERADSRKSVNTDVQID